MIYDILGIFLLLALAGIAGALNGLREASHKSNEVFTDAFGWDEDGWFGRNSWMLKYKDYPSDQSPRFLFSKTALAWLTDFWHFSNFIMVTLLLALPLLGNYSIPIAFGCRVSYAFVSHLAYSYINQKAGNAAN